MNLDLDLMYVIIPSVALVALLAIGLIVARLYTRATKEQAFVRTGFGGEKVIRDGGAIVLPVFHEITLVNMQTLRLEVRREKNDALITGDRMRVDVLAEFFVRVKPDADSIARAAQTLGERTMKPVELKSLIEGKFVDALRSVAAEMSMKDLHEKRADFVQKVQGNVAEDLIKNGLELETVSLTGLDQTSKNFFNPDNAFDAQGLLLLTKEIEERRKARNDIEQDTRIQIEQKNLEAERLSLEIEREQEYASMDQRREIAVRKADIDAQTKKEEADKRRQAENAEIEAKEAIEQTRIENEKITESKRIEKEKLIRQADIEKQKAIKIAEQSKEIEISEKSKAESKARAEADEARADQVRAEENVVTVKQVAEANRAKAIAIVKAEQEAEEDAVGIKVAAEAEKTAAEDTAEAKRIAAQGEADAITTVAKAKQADLEAEAEGRRKLNEAANILSLDQITLQIQTKLIESLPAIIAESVRPMEHIDSIKIVDVNGLQTGASGGLQGESSSGSLSDQLVSSALKYKAHSPLLDDLIGGLGLGALNDVAGIAKKAGLVSAAGETATADVETAETVEAEGTKGA
ncbi:flotillin domain-containing protein [Sulfurimonas sp. HSL-1656]|uniref:flotillin family protein n=1 Tax=Thiomicrolovo subterrani TaxID=3131934 RepID=UPI0031F88B36